MQLDFPQLRQTYEYDCGAKALQAVLAYYGIKIREEVLMREAKTNAQVGTRIKHMEYVLHKHDIRYDSRTMSVQEVKNYLDKKIPIIILLQAWGVHVTNYENDYNDGHWVVAIGHSGENIIFEDPYSFTRTQLSETELIQRWHAKEGKTKFMQHGIAVYGITPTYNSQEVKHME